MSDHAVPVGRHDPPETQHLKSSPQKALKSLEDSLVSMEREATLLSHLTGCVAALQEDRRIILPNMDQLERNVDSLERSMKELTDEMLSDEEEYMQQLEGLAWAARERNQKLEVLHQEIVKEQQGRAEERCRKEERVKEEAPRLVIPRRNSNSKLRQALTRGRTPGLRTSTPPLQRLDITTPTTRNRSATGATKTSVLQQQRRNGSPTQSTSPRQRGLQRRSNSPHKSRYRGKSPEKTQTKTRTESHRRGRSPQRKIGRGSSPEQPFTPRQPPGRQHRHAPQNTDENSLWPLITQAELETIPHAVRSSHITDTMLNDALRDLDDLFATIHLPRSPALSPTNAPDDGYHWVSENDIRNTCSFFRHGESTARATLSILRSLHRLDLTGGGHGEFFYRQMTEWEAMER